MSEVVVVVVGGRDMGPGPMQNVAKEGEHGRFCSWRGRWRGNDGEIRDRWIQSFSTRVCRLWCRIKQDHSRDTEAEPKPEKKNVKKENRTEKTPAKMVRIQNCVLRQKLHKIFVPLPDTAEQSNHLVLFLTTRSPTTFKISRRSEYRRFTTCS